jgi:hypothetical protein
VKLYVPAGVELVVVTFSVEKTSAVVIESGFVPKTAVAPTGRALAFKVRVHVLAFPPLVTVTSP